MAPSTSESTLPDADAVALASTSRRPFQPKPKPTAKSMAEGSALITEKVDDSRFISTFENDNLPADGRPSDEMRSDVQGSAAIPLALVKPKRKYTRKPKVVNAEDASPTPGPSSLPEAQLLTEPTKRPRGRPRKVNNNSLMVTPGLKSSTIKNISALRLNATSAVLPSRTVSALNESKTTVEDDILDTLQTPPRRSRPSRQIASRGSHGPILPDLQTRISNSQPPGDDNSSPLSDAPPIVIPSNSKKKDAGVESEQDDEESVAAIPTISRRTLLSSASNSAS